MKSIFKNLPMNENGKTFVRRIFLCLCIVLLAEIFLFNLKSFTTERVELDTETIAVRTNTPETVEISDDGICFRGDGDVIFSIGSEGINAMQIFFSGEDIRFLCTASMTDDNFSQQYITVAKKYTS